MKLNQVIEDVLGLPENTETNIERVVVRNGKAVFISACDVTVCSHMQSLRNEIIRLQNKMDDARAHLENAGKKMTEGMPKKEIRKAYEILNPSKRSQE